MTTAPTVRATALCPVCGAILIDVDGSLTCRAHGPPESDVARAYRLYCAQASAWSAYVAALAPMDQATRDALRRRIAEEER